MKELFKTNDPTLISFATALLKGEQITCFDLDVHMSILEGSIGIMPRRMMVTDEDYYMAYKILKDNNFDLSD